MGIRLDINTNFTDKYALIQHIKKSEFFFRFIDILKQNPKLKNQSFSPKIEKGKEIIFPQFIYYSEIPNFNLPFVELLEIDVEQKWILNENDENFECLIKVFFKENQIILIRLFFEMSHIDDTNRIILKLNSNFIDKVFFIPDSILENITAQVEKILKKLL